MCPKPTITKNTLLKMRPPAVRSDFCDEKIIYTTKIKVLATFLNAFKKHNPNLDIIETKQIYNNTYIKNTNTYNSLIDAASRFRVLDPKLNSKRSSGGSPNAYAGLPRKPALLKYQGMSPLVLMGRTSMLSAPSSHMAYARDSGGRILPFIVLIVTTIQTEVYAVKTRY